MERNQKIRKVAMRKTATNWTLSGSPIESGIMITGTVRMCHNCSTELMPYQDSCPNCKR